MTSKCEACGAPTKSLARRFCSRQCAGVKCVGELNANVPRVQSRPRSKVRGGSRLVVEYSQLSPRGHHCHARGCSVAVKPELLMCYRHWMLVPKKIQRAVWASYRPGQCDDKHPSESWHEAADAAIGYVAKLERRPLRPCEVEALNALGFGDALET